MSNYITNTTISITTIKMVRMQEVSVADFLNAKKIKVMFQSTHNSSDSES